MWQIKARKLNCWSSSCCPPKLLHENLRKYKCRYFQRVQVCPRSCLQMVGTLQSITAYIITIRTFYASPPHSCWWCATGDKRVTFYIERLQNLQFGQFERQVKSLKLFQTSESTTRNILKLCNNMYLRCLYQKIPWVILFGRTSHTLHEQN